MRAPPLAALCLSLTLAPRAALAHDHWLWPDLLVMPAPQPVQIRLLLGDELSVEEELALSPERITRFLLAQPSGDRDLRPDARPDLRPILRLDALTAGTHLLALDRSAARMELPAQKFEDYLREEGLASIIDERARRGEAQKDGRERYQRSLKAFVTVGHPTPAVFTREIGSDLELIPAASPSHGGRVAWQARFHQEPLPGLRLTLLTHAAGHVSAAHATTDAAGRADLLVPPLGVHLLRALHMVRCEGCADAEWHSFWTAVTFASFASPQPLPAPELPPLRPAPPPPGPPRRWLWAILGLVASLIAFTVPWRRR